MIQEWEVPEIGAHEGTQSLLKKDMAAKVEFNKTHQLAI